MTKRLKEIITTGQEVSIKNKVKKNLGRMWRCCMVAIRVVLKIIDIEEVWIELPVALGVVGNLIIELLKMLWIF